MYVMLDIVSIINYNISIIKSIKESELVIMSYTSKKNIVIIAAGLALIGAYLLYATGANAPAAEDVKAWAAAMCKYGAIGIGIQLLVQTLFHVAFAFNASRKKEVRAQKEKDDRAVDKILAAEWKSDEWTNRIDAKASRVGHNFYVMGVISLFVALAVGAEVVVALNLMFCICSFALIAEGVAGIVFHERSIR
jgi:hypothetical protein